MSVIQHKIALAMRFGESEERECEAKTWGHRHMFVSSVIEHKPFWLRADWLVFISAQSDFLND